MPLGSQLISGFWIGWMIEHSNKFNSKNPKKLLDKIGLN
jgi:hypothetical protein